MTNKKQSLYTKQINVLFKGIVFMLKPLICFLWITVTFPGLFVSFKYCFTWTFIRADCVGAEFTCITICCSLVAFVDILMEWSKKHNIVRFYLRTIFQNIIFQKKKEIHLFHSIFGSWSFVLIVYALSCWHDIFKHIIVDHMKNRYANYILKIS